MSVAKGYNQERDIDFEEMLALVAKMTTIKTLLAVLMVYNWDID